MASSDARPFPIKNTAFRAVFPILNNTGSLVTGAAGLDSEVSKDQGTFADCTNEATEIATASGIYYLDLTSTEMNADCVAVIVKTSTTDAKTTTLIFYPAESTDIPVNVTGWNGTAVATPDTAGYPKVTIKDGTGTGEIDLTSGGVLVSALAASSVTAAALATDAVAEIADGVWDEPTAGHVTAGTYGVAVSDILVDTAVIGAAGAGLTAVPWNASWDAEVQSEVNDGLVAFWTSPATLVDLVWDEPTAGHTTAGTTGKALIDAGSAGDPWSTALPGAYGAGTAGQIIGDNLDVVVSTRASQTSVDDLPTNAELATALDALPTAAENAVAVWDEATAGHVTAGTYGVAVSDILVDTAVIGAAGAGLSAIPWNAAWDAEVQSEVTDGLTAFWTSPATLVDLVWDEPLTGATHNVATSAGRRLRELDAVSIRTGTAQAGASNSITLDASASATNEIYDGNFIVLTGGTGIGQTRIIVEYNGTTKVATIDENWVTNPDATSEFSIIANQNIMISQHGLAQGGAAGSITLSASASASDDIYNGQTVVIRTSTGSGQARLITDYNGTTKVATVTPDWTVNPASASAYAIIPGGEVIVESFSTASLAAIQSEANDALVAYDPPTNAEMEARTIVAANYATASALATVDTEVGVIDGIVDAIKLKTDLIPAAPAAVGDIPTAVQNADALLGRTISGGANGGRDVTSALRQLRNKQVIAAGTLTVYQEDDVTSAWTAAITTAAGDPITEMDPA